MNHQSQVQASAIAPPKELAFMFENLPLVGDEKREEYDIFLLAIAEAVDITDNIDWMAVLDITALSWEIRRERKVKADIIKLAQVQVIETILQSIDSSGLGKLTAIFGDGREARRWASDPQARREIEARMAENGYDSGSILARAFVLAAKNIDAVDRRIVSYELRRMVALKSAEARSEKLALQLG